MIDDETTLKILECAKNDFLQNGYQGVSLKTICHHVGVTTGALYHRFSGKEELYKSIVKPISEKLLEVLKGSPAGNTSSIMPESCLEFVYIHLDVFKMITRCKCTAYYDEFYSATEECIYQRLLKANDSYEESICRLLSKAYMAAFFEIIRCDYDYETAQKCIDVLEKFFALQKSTVRR